MFYCGPCQVREGWVIPPSSHLIECVECGVCGEVGACYDSGEVHPRFLVERPPDNVVRGTQVLARTVYPIQGGSSDLLQVALLREQANSVGPIADRVSEIGGQRIPEDPIMVTVIDCIQSLGRLQSLLETEADQMRRQVAPDGTPLDAPASVAGTLFRLRGSDKTHAVRERKPGRDVRDVGVSYCGLERYWSSVSGQIIVPRQVTCRACLASMARRDREARPTAWQRMKQGLDL